MLEFAEIRPGDIIKVLVNIEDIEDEMYAEVDDNRGDYLIVRYYAETSLTYRGASVYKLEDETNLVQEDNVCEHLPDRETIFGCVNSQDRMYTIQAEESSDIESVLIDESDDGGSDVGSFIVSDSEFDGRLELPPDHVSIDRDWNTWTPRSIGSSRFKDTVDRIEEHARMHMDNVNF